MVKKRWRALRPLTLVLEPGAEFEKEYTEEEEEALLGQQVLEEVKSVPVKKAPASSVKGKDSSDGKD